MVPEFLEHRPDGAKEALAGLERPEQRLEVAF